MKGKQVKVYSDLTRSRLENLADARDRKRAAKEEVRDNFLKTKSEREAYWKRMQDPRTWSKKEQLENKRILDTWIECRTRLTDQDSLDYADYIIKQRTDIQKIIDDFNNLNNVKA